METSEEEEESSDSGEEEEDEWEWEETYTYTEWFPPDFWKVKVMILDLVKIMLSLTVSKDKSRFVKAVLILHRLFFVIIIVVFDKRFVEKNIVVAIFKKNFCCRQK